MKPEQKKKISNSVKRFWEGKKRIPWNNGKTNIYSKETLQKMSEKKLKDKNSFFGKQHSKKTKELFSKQRTGNKFAYKKGFKKDGGYIYILCNEHPNANRNYVAEHRLVVENFLGRYLKKEEVIHHINENKQDNRIENLMLFSTNSEHMKFHTKIKQFGMTNPILRQIKNRWLYQ